MIFVVNLIFNRCSLFVKFPKKTWNIHNVAKPGNCVIKKKISRNIKSWKFIIIIIMSTRKINKDKLCGYGSLGWFA